MNLVQNIVLVAIILAYALIEIYSRKPKDFHATKDDTKLELFMFVSLVAFSQPFIFAVTGKICDWLMPDQRDAWAGLPWWAMGAILLNHVHVGAGSIVGAGAVCPEGMQIPRNSLVLGVPARRIRDTTEAERERISKTVESYLVLQREHRSGKYVDASKAS